MILSSARKEPLDPEPYGLGLGCTNQSGELSVPGCLGKFRAVAYNIQAYIRPPRRSRRVGKGALWFVRHGREGDPRQCPWCLGSFEFSAVSGALSEFEVK